MNFLVIAVIAVDVVLAGAVAFLAPASLISFSKRFLTQKGRFWAAGVRLTMGIIFWFSAGSSKDADLIQVFAVIIFAAGIFTLFVKQAIFEKMLGWVFGWPHLAIRVWGVVAVAVGIWLISLF